MEGFVIEEAGLRDAPAIADAVVMAITPDTINEHMGRGRVSVQDVREAFLEMARREDTQYSYRNTLVARTPAGEIAGLIVGYDGALLHQLRKPFIDYITGKHGYDIGAGLEDETSADEFYLDTLAVKPDFRHRGVGTALLKAMTARAAAAGKPAGLLVDKHNGKARRLYESIGFRYHSDRSFFGEMMDRLVLVSS